MPNEPSGEMLITNRGGDVDIGGFGFHTEKLLELLGESCVPKNILDTSYVGCNDKEFIDTLSVTLSSYPGCTFVVVYSYYDCSAAGLTDITMGDFQILSHDCSSFTTALNNAFSLGVSAFRTFIDNFNLSIYDEIEDFLIDKFVVDSAYLCFFGAYFNITFIKSTCYKECIIVTDPHNGLATYAKVTCGADCCERHTTVCRQSDGSLNIDTNIAPGHPPICADPPVFIGHELLNRCYKESACRYVCP